MIVDPSFDSETIGSVPYLPATKFEISRWRFIVKPSFSLRHGYFNRDLSTVTLVKYYISMRHLNRKTQ